MPKSFEVSLPLKTLPMAALKDYAINSLSREFVGGKLDYVVLLVPILFT